MIIEHWKVAQIAATIYVRLLNDKASIYDDDCRRAAREIAIKEAIILLMDTEIEMRKMRPEEAYFLTHHSR